MAIETMTADMGTSAAPSGERRKDTGLICRAEGELRGSSPMRRCAEGVRFTDELTAAITAGPFAGARLTGLDQFTIRPDGTLVMAGPQAIESPAGPVALDLWALVITPPDSAPLDPDRVSAPDYDFPDLDLKVSGSALVRAAGPRYADLDGATASVEGWINFESGELEVEARVIRH